VGVQEIRRDGGGTEPAGEYKFFYGKGNENNQLRASFLVHKRIVSADVSYIILHWCDVMVLKAQEPTEDSIDDMKCSFYEKLERVFDKFPKHHANIYLGDFNRKWRLINTQNSYCRKYNFPTSLHL
jgi:hypothetical protein